MLTSMQLYSGNWMLFYNHLQPTANVADATVSNTATQEVVAQEPVIEDAHIHEDAQVPETASEHVVEEHNAAHHPPVLQEDEHVTDVEAQLLEEGVINIEEDLIAPVYSEDYFRHQGVEVSNALPEELSVQEEEDDEKSLMVMMSFADWLLHFKHKNEAESEEEKEQKAFKTMWQKEKLAAAAEEENEEIPENVFEMAVNSITNEDDLASESLADIYIKQKKYDKAVEMYHKLSLRNPQKNTYFARKIEEVLKEKQS